MIEVEGLTKYYGPLRAIHDLGFSIASGQIVGFLGLNGAGKSTALKILAGFLLPTSGSVRIEGTDLVAAPEQLRARIGFLPEDPPLYPEMSVRDYLLWLGRLRGMPEAKLKERVPAVIERTALADRQHDPIGTLSLGYRKRAGIAQAIVHDPALVILDEPISGLDPVQIVEMRKLVRSLAGQHTVLISSHILTEVEETCDRLLMLHQGELVAQGSETELVDRFERSHAYEIWIKGDGERAQALLAGLAPVAQADLGRQEEGLALLRVALRADEPELLAQALVQAGFGVRRLIPGRNQLEDAFLAMAGASQKTGAAA
jgi:ABC-2 type transport system ATP-binding protein